MARRNIFQQSALPAEDPSTTPTETPAPAFAPEETQPNTSSPRGTRTGSPVRSMGNALRELSANGVQDIDPSLIGDSPLMDRLPFDDADVAGLRDSIRVHGQQVPILVRPLPSRPGRFEIVYGRRRLRAIRGLGIKVRAIVRTMGGQDAMLAHGQENSVRLDPSFIEKALFAAALHREGYQNNVIQDALGIDKSLISRMSSITNTIPLDVIEAIGPAHEIGRRPWVEVASMIRDTPLDPHVALDEAKKSQDFDSDSRSRFRTFLATVTQLAADVAGGPARKASEKRSARSGVDRGQPLKLPDGSVLGELTRDDRSLSLCVSVDDAPEFSTWLEEHADEVIQHIHTEWLSRAKNGA